MSGMFLGWMLLAHLLYVFGASIRDVTVKQLRIIFW
jgi:hypothetical protein